MRETLFSLLVLRMVNEELVTEGRETFAQSILKICSANLSDGGQYICLATNLHGNDSATFDLTVNPVSGMCQTCFSDFMLA